MALREKLKRKRTAETAAIRAQDASGAEKASGATTETHDDDQEASMQKPRLKKRTRVMLKALDTVKSFKEVFERLNAQLKIHRHKIKNFSPHISFEFERGHFIVRTVVNGRELEQCLRLRFEVFHREFMGKNRTYGVDIDQFDFICDHLVIIDKRFDRTIGTYRLNCSKFNQEFYSAAEFDLGKLLGEPGFKLEMGRACIDKEYRTGAVMALLWRGIAEYIQLSESRYLFGCASVKTTDASESAAIYKWFKDNGHLDESFQIRPTEAYLMPGFAEAVAQLNSLTTSEAILAETEKNIPTLVHAYLKAGAKACGEPALDRDFSCIDFLMCLKIDEMSPLFARKYKL